MQKITVQFTGRSHSKNIQVKAIKTGADCQGKVTVWMLLAWAVVGGGCGRRASIIAPLVMWTTSATRAGTTANMWIASA